MTFKYEATDSTGFVHRRTSVAQRVYTHAVVYPGNPKWANWCGRADLAAKAAAGTAKEIIEARRVDKAARSK